MKTRTALVAIALAVAAHVMLAQDLIIANPLAVARPQEVVEVPLQQVLDHLHLSPTQASSIVAEDPATGQRIPSQLDSSSADAKPDLLLLLVQLSAHGQMHVRLRSDAAPRATERWYLAARRRSARTTLRGRTSKWLTAFTAQRLRRQAKSPQASMSGQSAFLTLLLILLQARRGGQPHAQSGAYLSQRQWTGA